MNTDPTASTRPPLDSLACANAQCELYGKFNHRNLTVRKVYGPDQIRYLRCRACQREFSERKGTALWNTKIREARAVAVAEHLADGCSQVASARLCGVDRSTVRRLQREVGQHGAAFHDQQVHDVHLRALQADERHGYAGRKATPVWEAEVIDPRSKFVLAHVQGPRDEQLIRQLLTEAAGRLANRHDVVLFTDGEASYASLFPEIFGTPYHPARQGTRGRRPNVRYRIPRTLAHVQIVKQRQGQRVVEVTIRYRHGSRKRVDQALAELGYTTPNTSAIERRNGTARLMGRGQTRRSLAFARRSESKQTAGWWGVTVYNWARPHTALRQPLPPPTGKKSMRHAPRLWPSV